MHPRSRTIATAVLALEALALPSLAQATGGSDDLFYFFIGLLMFVAAGVIGHVISLSYAKYIAKQIRDSLDRSHIQPRAPKARGAAAGARSVAKSMRRRHS